MIWLTWRQHRKQAMVTLIGLAALAAFVVPTGLAMHHAFDRLVVRGCATNAPGQPCDGFHEFSTAYGSYLYACVLLLIVPLLFGLFWGAPLVAREIEHGTHRFVWTQGVSRLRWATTKIGLVSLAVLLITAIYAAMLTWWITPVVETSGQRFGYVFFDIHGIVVFGYMLFALALGIFAGAVTGRLLPAMAATVVGFIGTRLLVMLGARDRYRPTVTRTIPDLFAGYKQIRNDLHGDWIVASGGTNTEVLKLHPADQFWTFQAMETAIFLALAAALILGSIYWVRRRIT